MELAFTFTISDYMISPYSLLSAWPRYYHLETLKWLDSSIIRCFLPWRSPGKQARGHINDNGVPLVPLIPTAASLKRSAPLTFSSRSIIGKTSREMFECSTRTLGRNYFGKKLGQTASGGNCFLGIYREKLSISRRQVMHHVHIIVQTRLKFQVGHHKWM